MLAVGMVRALGLPFGVIVNRAGLGDAAVQAWCETETIPVLLEIPFSKQIAETYASGGTLLDADPIWGTNMRSLADSLAERRLR
jgi:MinD superfamily P-loop ATPase